MKRFIASVLMAALVFTTVAGVPVTYAHNSSSYDHDTSGQARNPDWMSSIPDSFLISELSIPGTHDSMTYLGNAENGGISAQCQVLNLKDQLLSGIRAVDIRCAHYKNISTGHDSFAIFHGAFYQGSNFDDVLTTARSFLNDHPSETILMRVKEEDPSMGMLSGFELTDTPFSDTFEAYAQKYEGLMWIPGMPAKTPKLGEVRGKIVILQDFSGTRADGANFGLLWDSFSIQDNYNVSHTPDSMYDKWTAIRNHLKNADDANYREGKIYINYLSGTGLSGFPIAWPYFVASGHEGSGTNSSRSWTGYFDSDSFLDSVIDFLGIDYSPYAKGEWPDFPRSTWNIDILGNDDAADPLDTGWTEVDNIKIPATYFEGMNELTMSRLRNYDRVGIIMADFPGSGLINTVVGMNPWRFSPIVDAGDIVVIHSGESAAVNATFTDSDDTSGHSAIIDWGDSTEDDPAAITENTGSEPGTVSGSHRYCIPGEYSVTVYVSDDEGTGDDSLIVNVLPVSVSIDVRTVINPKATGAVQVIITGEPDFDVSKLLIETLRIGPKMASVVQNATDDVNGDGQADRILHFRMEDIGINEKDTQLILTGQNSDGIYFEGKAPVKVIVPKK